MVTKRATTLFVFILFAASLAFSQNNLAPGDLAIVSYQSDFDPTNLFTPGLAEFEDRFSIVVLTSAGLSGGTVIYFTDRGWNGPFSIWYDEQYPPFTFGSGSEAVIKWTVPAGGILAGKEVYFINKYHDELPAGSEYYEWLAFSNEQFTVPLGTISNVTTIVPPPAGPGITDGVNFPVSGDNLLVYQTGPTAGPATNYNDSTRRFITALLANIRPTSLGTPTSFASWDPNPASPDESSMPPGLANGDTAFLMSPGPLPHPTTPVPSSVEPDNGKFNCTALAHSITPAQRRAIIYNNANWTYSANAFPQGFSSGGCNYNVPTAAGVSVTGRVLSANGNGLRNAVVKLTGSDGVTRRAVTSSLGYYRFDDVAAGETYVIGVASKQFVFTPRTISITDELTDVDFVAESPEPAFSKSR